MIRHRHIEKNLYDYVAGGLPEELRAEIEAHLRTCARCGATHTVVQRTLSLVRPPQAAPSSERSEEFWNTFAAGVEQRIDERQTAVRVSVPGFREDFRSVLGMRWRTGSAIAGAFALITVLFLLFRSPAPEVSENTVAAAAAESRPHAADKSLSQYFRRSQAVLVGLENKCVVSGRRIDLDAERTASRRLANEGRFLKNQPIDPRSARLVRDLERIFIKVANSSPQDDHGDFELIRGGIRQENLLFKVRMAQARYEPDRNE